MSPRLRGAPAPVYWPRMATTKGMRLIGLSGWSGAGKTTLLARLIPELVGRGLTVSTLKHAHHAFDIDKPGKDSYVHREAGATEVLIASGRRFALMHELRGAPEPTLPELLARLAPVDLVLVEGFKRGPHPKIEIFRAANGKPPIHPEDPFVVAVASDVPLPEATLRSGTFWSPRYQAASPGRPRKISPVKGWAMRPARARPSTVSPTSVPHTGTPAMNARVPSMGSMIQA